MTSFLSSSCCNGRRPRRWMGATIHPRPDLVSRLMRERQVARFLVAPPGYGKTFLALEYAQVIFEFNHVIWIDARSPCFLRDLDCGGLAADVMKRDPGMRLAVFDDVPRLGAQRADLLSKAIDELLDAGSEVMVLCHPSSDAFAGRQIDRICLSARDLMLSAEECEGATEGREGSWQSSGSVGSETRSGIGLENMIPQLAWGPQDACARFVGAIAHEELPVEVLSVQFVILAVGDASISETCRYWGLLPSQITALERDYPHLGVVPERDLFSSVRIDSDCLARAYASRLRNIGNALSFGTVDELGIAVANALMVQGNEARACEMVAATAGRDARAMWLSDNARPLSRALCVLPAWRLGKTLGKLRSDTLGSRLEAQQAWRLCLLGDVRSALLAAGRVASRATAPFDARVASLVMIVRYGSDVVRVGALERLSLLAEGVSFDEEDYSMRGIDPESVLALCLAERYKTEVEVDSGGSLSEAAERLKRVWRKAATAGIDGDAVLLAGALLLDLCPALCEDGLFLRVVENEGEDGPVGIYRLEALRVIGDLGHRDPAASRAIEAIVSEAVSDQIRRAERDIAQQQRGYGAFARAQEKRRANRTPGTRSVGDSSASESHLPHAQISLFGGIEVVVEGRRLDAEAFTKTKMRALLAILTMAGGREVSCDRLLDDLWPGSRERTAKKNLYTNWAALRRTLSLPDGSCPFLHHVQGSYRIDGRLVTSDVQQVSVVCRALAIEKPDPDRFRELLEDLQRLYRGDLLPSEVKCDVIVNARDEYRSQVSDALVQASFRLLDMGEYQTALWFARSALEHERRQEDPYYALMSAQVACGQREAALETFRICSRALLKAFNIDPSQRMISLYRQITETEEHF